MRYVALLRGINVGGKNRVAMQQLKTVFEQAGCSDVRTYINSGNVVFTDTRELPDVHAVLVAAIESDFGFPIAIQLRTQSNIKGLIDKIPADWQNDTEQRTDVMFLDDTIKSTDLDAYVVINPALDERIIRTDSELIWNIARVNVTKGNGIKLIGTDIYKHMTIRNVNTVRKLAALL